jgi:hypothetical protein
VLYMLSGAYIDDVISILKLVEEIHVFS